MKQELGAWGRGLGNVCKVRIRIRDGIRKGLQLEERRKRGGGIRVHTSEGRVSVASAWNGRKGQMVKRRGKKERKKRCGALRERRNVAIAL